MVVPRFQFTGRYIICTISLCLSLFWVASPTRALAGDSTHVLTLSDGSICYGALLPNSAEDQVVFKVEGFADPLVFPQAAIRSLRKLADATEEKPEKKSSGSGWLVRLRDQQAIVGELQSLDEDGLSISSPSVGTVKIPRDQLVRIEQGSSARDPIKTVMQKAEWKDPNEMNSWKIEPSRASTSAQGARLLSDFAIPGRCEIRMNLRWSKKPNFAIGFGVDKNSVTVERAQWGVAQAVKIATVGRKQAFASIETWGEDLIFVRESSTLAGIEQLGTTKAASCELTIFIDIREGVAAARINNSSLKKLKVESKAVAGKLQALEFLNFTGDLAIENLEILKWNGQLPLDYFGQPSFVQNTKGEKLDGFVNSYDPQSKSFVIKSGETDQTIAATELMAGALLANSIDAASEAKPETKTDTDTATKTTEPPEQRAVEPKSIGAIITLNDGGQLAGRFLPAEQGVLRLSSKIFGEPLKVPLAAIQEITTPEGPLGTTDEAGSLIAKVGLSELKGRLIQCDPAEGKSALLWQQTSAVNTSELDYEIAGELMPLQPSVSPKPAKNTPTTAQAKPADQNLVFQLFGFANPANEAPASSKPNKENKDNATELLVGSLIRFRSGDSTPAKVLQINEKGVRFESELTTTTFAPNSTIDQVVFRTTKNKALPDDQRKRLLTIPRSQQNDPPTHLLISVAGDFLRGHLIEINSERASIEVRGERLEVPVAELSEVIWLYERDWKTPREKTDEQTEAVKPEAAVNKNREVYVVYGGKQGIALRPTKVADGFLFGASDLLGSSQVPLAEMTALFWGPNTGQKARELRNQSYRLTLAQMPREAPDDEDSSTKSTAHPLVGKPAPIFTLKNLAGENVQLEKLRGKVIVLDFWATWCGPCMQTMPILDQMMSQFDSSKVQLYAVNIQEPKNRVDLALKRLKIEPEVLLDAEGEVGNAYQANAIPQTVIIDAEGNVVRVFVGGGAGVVNQIRDALVDHLETSKN